MRCTGTVNHNLILVGCGRALLCKAPVYLEHIRKAPPAAAVADSQLHTSLFSFTNQVNDRPFTHLDLTFDVMGPSYSALSLRNFSPVVPSITTSIRLVASTPPAESASIPAFHHAPIRSSLLHSDAPHTERAHNLPHNLLCEACTPCARRHCSLSVRPAQCRNVVITSIYVYPMHPPTPF